MPSVSSPLSFSLFPEQHHSHPSQATPRRRATRRGRARTSHAFLRGMLLLVAIAAVLFTAWQAVRWYGTQVSQERSADQTYMLNDVYQGKTVDIKVRPAR